VTGATGTAGTNGTNGSIFVGGGTISTTLNTNTTPDFIAAGVFAESDTQTSVALPIPAGGVVSNLQVRLSGTIGAAPNSYAFTVIRNNVAVAGLTCTVTGPTATTCTDTDTTSWSAGDTISLRSVAADNPSPITATWSVTIG
jgi:hypothetical protein